MDLGGCEERLPEESRWAGKGRGVGDRWMREITRRVERARRAPGEVIDLWAITVGDLFGKKL